MILHPSVLALVAASLVTAGLLLYGARWAVTLLRRWDLRSGSALQLELERRTSLVSTVLGYVLAFELASIFLYVYTADALAPLFTGAMCAAGTLAAGTYGYPVLLLKLLNFVLAGLWLALNQADRLGHDYPLVRPKYALLLTLAPTALLEAALQLRFFAGLRPDVITSCCGSLFATSGRGLAGQLGALPMLPTAIAFFALLAAAIATGVFFLVTRRGGYPLGALAAAAVPVSLAAVIAFVSPYVYELPTHRCPFCLLQGEYRFVGYGLYGALLGGGVSGMAVGVLQPFRRVASLATALPLLQRRLAAASVTLFSAALAVVCVELATSQLRM